MLPIKACVKTLGSLCARLLAFWGSTSLPGGNSSDSRDQASARAPITQPSLKDILSALWTKQSNWA